MMRLYLISDRDTGRGTVDVARLTPDENPLKMITELVERLDELDHELAEIEKDLEYNRRKYLQSLKRVERQVSAKIFFEIVKRRQEETLYRQSNITKLRREQKRRTDRRKTIQAAIYRHLCRTEEEFHNRESPNKENNPAS